MFPKSFWIPCLIFHHQAPRASRSQTLMLFVVAIWAIWYAVKSNQFEDLDNAPEQIILDDRQERRKILKKDSRK